MPARPELKASQNSAALFPNPEMTPTPVITTLLTVCIFEPGVRDEYVSRIFPRLGGLRFRLSVSPLGSAARLLFLEFVHCLRVHIDAL